MADTGILHAADDIAFGKGPSANPAEAVATVPITPRTADDIAFTAQGPDKTKQEELPKDVKHSAEDVAFTQGAGVAMPQERNAAVDAHTCDDLAMTVEGDVPPETQAPKDVVHTADDLSMEGSNI